MDGGKLSKLKIKAAWNMLLEPWMNLGKLPRVFRMLYWPVKLGGRLFLAYRVDMSGNPKVTYTLYWEHPSVDMDIKSGNPNAGYWNTPEDRGEVKAEPSLEEMSTLYSKLLNTTRWDSNYLVSITSIELILAVIYDRDSKMSLEDAGAWACTKTPNFLKDQYKQSHVLSYTYSGTVTKKSSVVDELITTITETSIPVKEVFFLNETEYNR